MKKAIIIIVSVLVVALGTCTCLYFFTDTFNFLKPASTNFSNQAKKLLGTDKDNKYSNYEEFLNRLKLTDKSYVGNADISMNVSLPSSVVDSSTQKLINSSTVKYSGSYDASSKAMSNNIGLYKDSKEFLTLKLLQKDQTMSIGCSDLYDKTLNFDMSKYEEFCQKNNITVDDETKESINMLNSLNDNNSADLLYDLFYLSEADYNSLNKTYGNLLVDLIDNDNYSTKKNQKISVNGDDVKTTAYSLTLSGEDTYNLINKFVDLVKKDETTKKLIIDKYKVLKKYNGVLYSSYSETSSIVESTNSEEFPDLTTDDIDKYLDELVKKLEENKDKLTKSDECLKFTIYSNKKSEPVKFEISALKDKKDKDGSVLFTEDLSDGKTKYTISIKELNNILNNDSNDDDDDTDIDIFSNTSKNTTSSKNNTSTDNIISSINSSSKSNSKSSRSSSSSSSSSSTISTLMNSLTDIIIEDDYTKTDDSKKGTITVSAKASGSKQDMLKIDYENINSKSEYKSSFSVSCPLYSSVSLDYTYDITGLDSDTQNIKFEVNGKYNYYSAKLSATGSITYGKSNIPELTADNSVDVFNLSKEDYQKLETDIITKASDTLPEKLALYGIKVTKEEILSAIPDTQPTATQDATTPDTTTPDATNPVVTEPAA